MGRQSLAVESDGAYQYPSLIVSSRPSGVRDICGGTSIPLKVVLSVSSSFFSTAVSDEMANIGIIRERSDQANIDGFMMAGYQGDEIEKRKPNVKNRDL